MIPYLFPSSAGPRRLLNPRQNISQQGGSCITRTINDTIEIYVEGCGSRLLGFAVHHWRLEERTNFVDASVSHLFWNHGRRIIS